MSATAQREADDDLSVRSASEVKKKNEKRAKQYRPKTRTFFRGPKRDALPKLDEDSGNRLLVCAKKLITTVNSKSDEIEPKHKSETCRERCIRDELIFGLNGVLRNVEKGVTLGVIANDPLSINIQETICEIAISKKIPIVFVSGFSDLKTNLDISNLTCLAFKPSVKDSKAIFNEFYNLFLQTALQFECNKHESDENESKIRISAESKANCDSLQKSTEKNEIIFNFAKPDFDDLYVARNTNVDDILVARLPKSVEHERDIYFPERYVEQLIELRFDVFPSKTKNVEDKEFAKILMEVEDELVKEEPIKMKRKSNQLREETAEYKSVSMIQLFPSSNKSKTNSKKKCNSKKVESKK